MDEEETLNNVAMLISGSRTSLTLLGNGLHALLEHPAEFRKLREDRELMKQAIEEMLRYEPGSSIIPPTYRGRSERISPSVVCRTSASARRLPA